MAPTFYQFNQIVNTTSNLQSNSAFLLFSMVLLKGIKGHTLAVNVFNITPRLDLRVEKNLIL